jgi:hypothetical protein
MQEVKDLKDKAKRAGKKAKDEFKEKEMALLERHSQELQALESAKAQESQSIEADGRDDVQQEQGKVRTLPFYFNVPAGLHTAMPILNIMSGMR